MGYYSETAAVMKKADFDKLVEKASKELKSLLNVAAIQYFKELDTIEIYWTWIKWYTSYDEIEEFENYLFEDLASQNKPYKFVRIGEEYEDVEVYENYSDDDINEDFYQLIDIPRTIIYNADGEEYKIDNE